MKNLPATIGLVVILMLLFFFKGNPDHAAQAAPIATNGSVISEDALRQSVDTMPKKHHPEKKDWKKKGKGMGKDTTWRPKKDSVQ
ncbi:hypothetical protein FHW36_11076 [Chitinophaga polysaccharea]|uniref:Uncharacterized protein n=1 Tax=Chitinophaga polysaccharea TaxID=1293035 RepID=A0A561P9X9_9BACT|nr:hypothetical protein [Chitinophaga polysaccharea]TWF34878.1 hypothetical protein FHW36_11076 [Chitinophaga polysaccharea]